MFVKKDFEFLNNFKVLNELLSCQGLNTKYLLLNTEQRSKYLLLNTQKNA